MATPKRKTQLVAALETAGVAADMSMGIDALIALYEQNSAKKGARSRKSAAVAPSSSKDLSARASKMKKSELYKELTDGGVGKASMELDKPELEGLWTQMKSKQARKHTKDEIDEEDDGESAVRNSSAKKQRTKQPKAVEKAVKVKKETTPATSRKVISLDDPVHVSGNRKISTAFSDASPPKPQRVQASTSTSRSTAHQQREEVSPEKPRRVQAHSFDNIPSRSTVSDYINRKDIRRRDDEEEEEEENSSASSRSASQSAEHSSASEEEESHESKRLKHSANGNAATSTAHTTHTSIWWLAVGALVAIGLYLVLMRTAYCNSQVSAVATPFAPGQNCVECPKHANCAGGVATCEEGYVQTRVLNPSDVSIRTVCSGRNE